MSVWDANLARRFWNGCILSYIRYHNMPTHDKSTTDSAQSSPTPAQQKPSSGIIDKIGGVVNVIHGTGEVIRGHALEAGDFGRGRGDGKEIIAAGRNEVERGLNRIEGTATSATGQDQGTGAAPGHDPNTVQAGVAPRTDPTSEKGRGDATDTGYLGDRGTAGAAANDTHSPPPEQYHGEKTAATAPHRDSLNAGTGVQPNTDVRQQGNGIAPSDRGKETRPTAGTQYSADAAGQGQHSGKAAQA